MRLRVIVAGVLLGAAATGCLYFTDLTGLSGEDAPGSADGSTDAAISADGPAEGSQTDGPTTLPDGGTTSPCAVAHNFCADFDNGPLGKGWEETRNQPPANLSLDPLSLSSPSSLRSLQPRRTDSAFVFASVVQQLGTLWRKAVFQGDLLMKQPAWVSGDSNVALMRITYDSDTIHSGSILFAQSADSELTIEHQPDGPSRYVVGEPVPYGRWVHVTFEFDPAGHASYSFDDKKFEKTFAALSPGAGQTYELEVGMMSYNHPVPAFDIRWDNVYVNLF